MDWRRIYHKLIQWWPRYLMPRDLINCGLVMPYDVIKLYKLWFGQWRVAWRHQTISWTSVEFFLVRSSGIDLRAIPQRAPKLFFCIMSLKIVLLKLLKYLPGVIKLTIVKTTKYSRGGEPAEYSAIPISRGHFPPNNSRKTPIARPHGRAMGVFREFEVIVLCAITCYTVPRYIGSL